MDSKRDYIKVIEALLPHMTRLRYFCLARSSSQSFIASLNGKTAKLHIPIVISGLLSTMCVDILSAKRNYLAGYTNTYYDITQFLIQNNVIDIYYDA